MTNDILRGLFIVFSAMAIVLTIMGIVHDLSDGIVDGVSNINNRCEVTR